MKKGPQHCRRSSVRPQLCRLDERIVPTVFTVTSLDDSGPGSLRQMLADAGSAAGPDTIVFAPALSGQTIRLATALSIGDTNGVTVVGDGVITLSGDSDGDSDGDTQIIINSGNLTLDGLRLERGRNADTVPFSGGGAIRNLATLSIINSAVANSSAANGGGIFNAGTLTIADSAITGNSATGGGGGIHSDATGTAVISDSTLSNNSASNGGGLSMTTGAGAVTLNRTIISGNTASSTGGGVASYSFSGVLTLRDCTVAANSAPFTGGLRSNETGRIALEYSTVSGNSGGGIFKRYGALTLLASTISGNSNGPGIFVRTGSSEFDRVEASTIVGNQATSGAGGLFVFSGSIRLTSSIVAGNGNDIGGTLVASSASNLIGNASSAGGLIHGVNGNIVGNGGSGELPIASILSPLAQNGGLTPTHALVAGGPAIDTGASVFGLTTDQRGEGFYRIVGASPDIGAFEFNPLPRPTAMVTINQGATQRSRVNRIDVTFSDAVAFPSGMASAFQLSRTGAGGPTGNVHLALSQTGNVVTITIDDPDFLEANGSSLIDGRYALSLVATKIVGAGGPLDGNGDGVGGDNRVAGFHRYYGDMNGDARVDISDFGFFSLAYLQPSNYNAALDFNNDGRIDIADFGQFSVRYFTTLP